jgi:hypothetical protein
MERKPSVFTIALFIIVINASIWFVFSILVAMDALPLGAIPDTLRWILVALSLIASGALFVLSYFLKKRNRLAYYLTLLALFGLIVLTFMDEVGIIDLVYLVVALVPFLLLLHCRRWYLSG